MFKKFLVIIFIQALIFPIICFSQKAKPKNFNPPFVAGFESILLKDRSRQFKFSNTDVPNARPIRLLVWFPAQLTAKSKRLKFSDYVFSSDLRKNLDDLSLSEKERLIAKLLETLSFFKVNKDQLNNLLVSETRSYSDTKKAEGKFPLIVLTNVGDGYHYYYLAEMLASNGYVVFSLPSLGTGENEMCGFTQNCINIQQKDLKFAINYFSKQANVDNTKIGLLSWSFSGLASISLPENYSNIKGIVSLDAATGYEYGKELLAQSAVSKDELTSVGFLHFYGKNENPRVPRNLDFFNSYPNKNKYLVVLDNLQHSDFIPLYGYGVRIAKNIKEPPIEKEIEKVSHITLSFFNKFLRNDLSEDIKETLIEK